VLAKALEMQLDACMSKPVKRTRTVARKTAVSEITVRPFVDKEGYAAFLVQGWKEDGKWKRKQFKERADAERFAALKRVQRENQGRAQRMILSALTDEQAEEALRAFDKLGGTYSLTEAVSYFLRNHRPPEFTIRIRDAVKLYLDEKERDGLRPRSVKAIESVLGQFATATDDPWTHEATPDTIRRFLSGLRAKNGTDKATSKTWNNYRNDLGGFFAWCSSVDASTNRPFIFENPVSSVRKFSARQVREEQEARPATTETKMVLRQFSVLSRWRGGIMVYPFALLYFAGIRPEELKRMKGREKELINLKTGTITIPANVSKTRHERQIAISHNLTAWLKAFPGEAYPTNADRLAKMVRKHFKLSHDEARHSFISYHVALNRSIGDAALQAGNSEAIVKRHYLNTHSREEGDEFFRIVPGKRRAVLSTPKKEQPTHLRAV